ncbi:uncharacterized protein LOC112555881 isoform X2 [Pomacea canaliculata]|uniref:uncharacterized protein LOC112555881 isoform X2 n=1 Tax=Pomacea canaliculata TaxID=400727 RepID=UPI000D73E491|nr:uncharacterized protein LOC112555881 isoform X2 [Pomacea canaliculata]
MQVIIFFHKKYADVITKEELSLKMRNISKHIVAQIDKAFDILEVYLTTNIFRIPHNMVLPEDQIQMDSPVSQDELVEVQEKIALATKKILAVKLANAILKKRLQDIMYLQETFDNLLQELQAAKSEVTKERVCGIKDTIRYCASKILGSISAMEELKDSNLHVDSKYIKAIITFLEEKSEPEREKISNLE